MVLFLVFTGVFIAAVSFLSGFTGGQTDLTNPLFVLGGAALTTIVFEWVRGARE